MNYFYKESRSKKKKIFSFFYFFCRGVWGWLVGWGGGGATGSDFLNKESKT